jgi:hypothetical protein
MAILAERVGLPSCPTGSAASFVLAKRELAVNGPVANCPLGKGELSMTGAFFGFFDRKKSVSNHVFETIRQAWDTQWNIALIVRPQHSTAGALFPRAAGWGQS